MNVIEQQAQRWIEKHKKHYDRPAVFRKLCEEIGELGEALIRGKNYDILEESGDVLFVFAHLLWLTDSSISLVTLLLLVVDKNEEKP